MKTNVRSLYTFVRRINAHKQTCKNYYIRSPDKAEYHQMPSNSVSMLIKSPLTHPHLIKRKRLVYGEKQKGLKQNIVSTILIMSVL